MPRVKIAVESNGWS